MKFTAPMTEVCDLDIPPANRYDARAIVINNW